LRGKFKKQTNKQFIIIIAGWLLNQIT